MCYPFQIITNTEQIEINIIGGTKPYKNNECIRNLSPIKKAQHI